MAIPWIQVIGLAKGAMDQGSNVADRYFSVKKKELDYRSNESDNSRIKSLSADSVRIEEIKLDAVLSEIDSKNLSARLDHERFIVKSKMEFMKLKSDINIKDRQMNLIEDETRLRNFEARSRLISEDAYLIVEQRDRALRVANKKDSK